MKEILRTHIEKRLGPEPEGLETVLNSVREIKVGRNEFLLKEGEVCKYVYYIAKGCLQVFVYDQSLNETTRDIVVEDNWCSELISFSKAEPALENIRAVENSQLFAIDRNNFELLMSSVPQFDIVYKQILEMSYANSVHRINTFVALSALERIKWLIEYRPSLMSRLPSKLIASYLGISQETFSRLRAKV
ncbi:MAG: Crp/Fnr family transcriptional regulator [Chitinophagales bacterium]|nr:Crp/Fnr family transcriptional regulator [Chitinophagales bacterium]